jgi:uncharacterized protein RhaS with RHS repeats
LRKSEFVYDPLGRRRQRKEYEWRGGWVKTAEVRYVHDGNLVIQERDAQHVPQVTYTRGADLSGTLDGAGGIGGLLATTRHSPLPTRHYYYFADGNGNVTMLVDTNQQLAASYVYDPYGNLLGKSGPLADDNLYRFSSKELHLTFWR